MLLYSGDDFMSLIMTRSPSENQFHSIKSCACFVTSSSSRLSCSSVGAWLAVSVAPSSKSSSEVYLLSPSSTCFPWGFDYFAFYNFALFWTREIQIIFSSFNAFSLPSKYVLTLHLFQLSSHPSITPWVPLNWGWLFMPQTSTMTSYANGMWPGCRFCSWAWFPVP